MAAALLVPGKTVLHKVPHISDVETLLDIFRCIGVETGFRPDGSLEIDAKPINTTTTPHDLVRQMRASFNILGVLLTRFGRASVAMPGGCDIGARPVDFHVMGLEKLGGKLNLEHGIYTGAVDRLIGANIDLTFPSAGATQHLMMAASLAEGRTVISNCAAEPEIVDLADFLNACGARISGAGTTAITIDGVDSLHPAEFTVISDRLQAGTYALAAAITGGDVVIRNAVPEHNRPLLSKLVDMGVQIDPAPEVSGYRVRRPGKIYPTNITTMPHPGFPTDMQQPLGAVLSLACGTSTITEKVYENRFRYTTELSKLGADIHVEGRTAIITGVERLTGATVTCTDLRGGAAVVIAGLAAEGDTVVEEIAHLDRGYEGMVDKLRGLGADITRGTEKLVAGGLRMCSA
jgi:UDP-N-acetylglucosamine 1-carboxyvinyltransferase